MSRTIWLAPIVLSAAAVAAAAGSGPGGIGPFRAEFALSNGKITVGRVDMKLVRDGDSWLYSSRTKPTGIFAMLRNDRTKETTRLIADSDRVRTALT